MSSPGKGQSYRDSVPRLHADLATNPVVGSTGLSNVNSSKNATQNSGPSRSTRDIHSRPPLRGIYLRPTLFMIDGTATHLMEVLFPLNCANATSTSAATNSFVDCPNTTAMSLAQMTIEQRKWWGYRPPCLPASLVFFDYALCSAVPDFAATGRAHPTVIGSGEYTEEELVQEPSHPAHSALSDQWIAYARELSLSLRENRLSAPFRAECYRVMNDPQPQPRASLVLGGCGEGIMFNNSVLPNNIDVALRAMRPGEEFAFIMVNSAYLSEEIYGTYGTHGAHHSPFAFMRFVYIQIRLVSRIPHESIMPTIVQKYILGVPPNTPLELEGEGVSSTGQSQNRMNISSFFCFLDLFCIHPNMTLHQAKLFQDARCALLVAMMSALGNCLVLAHPLLLTLPYGDNSSDARVGGLDDGSQHFLSNVIVLWQQLIQHGVNGIHLNNRDGNSIDNDNSAEENTMTDEDAIAFLRTYFFAVPRDGAMVSCRVIRSSPLTGKLLPPVSIRSKEIGGMSLPLWLEVILQTMRHGEENIVNLQLDGEDDFFLYGTLAKELRMISATQLGCERVIQPRDKNLVEEQNKQKISFGRATFNSFDTLNAFHMISNDNCKGDLEYNMTRTNDMVGCKVILDGFTNEYDISAFFFVNPETSLRVAQKLHEEINALFEIEQRKRDKLERNIRTDKTTRINDNDEDEDNGGGNNEGNDDENEDEDVALPTCATVKSLSVYPLPFGYINRQFMGRGLVKAICKVNFAILLLTFHVNEQRMLEGGILPELMEQRHKKLMDSFCFLGCLYENLQCDNLCELSIEAFSAAIVLAPDDPLLWYRRGQLLRLIRENHSAMNDIAHARMLVETKLHQYISLQASMECDRESGDINATSPHSTPTPTADSQADKVIDMQRFIVEADRALCEIKSLLETKPDT